jgi:hypothetical protein
MRPDLSTGLPSVLNIFGVLYGVLLKKAFKKQGVALIKMRNSAQTMRDSALKNEKFSNYEKFSRRNYEIFRLTIS